MNMWTRTMRREELPKKKFPPESDLTLACHHFSVSSLWSVITVECPNLRVSSCAASRCAKRTGLRSRRPPIPLFIIHHSSFIPHPCQGCVLGGWRVAENDDWKS